ncbi:MAG: HEPN domain-containing protein [Parabacteroides gordonii]|uniref:HEPN domain-containing protein n=1 Tax=Parabacteroides gordonii TaxID=574930 RepID=UPI003A86B6C4
MNEELRQDIVHHQMQSARTCMDEVLYLRQGDFFNAAMARLYYACFHAASALLIAYAFESKTHNGVRTILGKEFVQTGKISPELGRFYTKLFNKRQDGDYDNFIFFDDTDLEEFYPQAVIFIEAIEKIIQSR